MSAADYLPETRTLSALREAAKSCHGCDLWRTATQTVFGEGSEGADLMFVGEQPGDLGAAREAPHPSEAELGGDDRVPSVAAILRAEDRDAMYAGFLADLQKVAKLL